MIVMIKQKQPRMTISIVKAISYMHGGCMVTIGKIPQKVKLFFKPTKNNVSAHVYSYYCNFVIAICISHASTIGRLVKLLRSSTHRTNHGEFLWRSKFGEMAVVRDQACGILKRLYKKRRKDCLLIIDDTQTIKRAKKMQAVGKIYKRWAIEVMIKEQKQHLGLGDYRVWRYTIVRHLCLVDSAYACLTHVGIDSQRAQGHKNDTKDMLSLPPISQLKARMHQIIWNQEVQNVIKVSHDK